MASSAALRSSWSGRGDTLHLPRVAVPGLFKPEQVGDAARWIEEAPGQGAQKTIACAPLDAINDYELARNGN